MKKLTFSLMASVALATTSFAGQEIVSAKDKVIEPIATSCFNEHEWQVDVFGAYTDGLAQSHAGMSRDHGWGGGVGASYFFTRYIGIGAEGYWVQASSNAARPGADGNANTISNVTGNVFFRYPIDSICLAPYAFLGGGAAIQGGSMAEGHAGIGLEYRVVPAKVGLFADSRWNYFGDRWGQGNQNNWTFRAGVRFVF